MLGVSISYENTKYLLVNVYLPYERTDQESIDAYRSRVHFLSSIIETEEFTDIVIAGDLNADPNRGETGIAL